MLYLLNFIVNLISTILLYAFFHVFLNPRQQSRMHVFVIFAASLSFQFFGSLLFSNKVLSIFKPIVWLAVDVLFGFLLFQMKPFVGVIYTALYYLAIGIIESITITLMDFAGMINSSDLESNSNVALFGVTLLARLLEFIVILIMRVFKKKKFKVDRKKIILAVPLISAVFCFVMYIFFWQQNNETVKLLLLIFGGFLLIQSVVVSLYVNMVFSSQQKADEYSTAYERQKEFFLAKNAKDRAERQMVHDMRNHFVIVMTALNDNDIAYAKEYLTSMDKNLQNLLPVRVTGNPDVDSLLYFKSNAVKEKGIEISVKGDLPSEISISPVDLNAIVGNAIDNAIESVDPRKNNVIQVIFKYHKERLRVTVINSHGGSVKKRADGKIMTSKASGGGNGIAIMEQTAKKYGGFVLIDYDEHTFSIEVMLHTNIAA